MTDTNDRVSIRLERDADVRGTKIYVQRSDITEEFARQRFSDINCVSESGFRIKTFPPLKGTRSSFPPSPILYPTKRSVISEKHVSDKKNGEWSLYPTKRFGYIRETRFGYKNESSTRKSLDYPK